MAETQVSDATADALSGTTETVSDLKYPTIAAEYYTDDFRRWYHLLKALEKTAFAFQVVQDGSLTIEVRPGVFMDGDSQISYAGVAAQAVTDDQTNYVYLVVTSGAAVLTISTSAFPTPSVTEHIRLAEVVAASGAITGVTDRRDTCLFRLLT